MKKLVFLCVALLVAPAMAVVEFSGDGTTTAGECSIRYDGTLTTDLPRGIAVKLTCTGTVEISGGTVDQEASKMNCFIDYAYTDPYGNYDVGDGHPFADPAAAGLLDVSGGVTEVSLCMGVLDEDGNQAAGPQAAEIIVLTVSGEGTIEVTADTLRGPDSGVVGSPLESNLPISIDVGGGIPECIKSDSPLYPAWEALGKPKCWCYSRNCQGDADGKKIGDFWVQSEDLDILIGSFFKLDAELPAGGACADFDHKKIGDFRVQSEDLDILIEYFFDVDVPECPKDWDGDTDDDYNFWEIPS